jgi:RES domain-containing protein
MPRVDVAMDVLLQKSLDLRHPETIERLGLTVVDLMEEWESAQQSNQEALSQCVGRIAAEMGIQGLLYPSARVEDATNLVIFPPCLDEECMLAPQGINGVD